MLYKYVGPDEIRKQVSNHPPGFRIKSISDVKEWIQQTGQKLDKSGRIRATFVIDRFGFLLIADRHSEHVACAGGGPVLSAGEISFAFKNNSIEIKEISNQSTGYCPEPASWKAVKKALAHMSIKHPDRFTNEIIFRRCPSCGERNIVKDGWYFCDICDAPLPLRYNFNE